MLMNARNLSVIKSLKFNFELIRKLSTRTESTCWSCSKQLSESERKSFFCPCEKHVILPVNPTTNYFDMFDLKVEYPIEKKQMVKKFRDHMRKLHPDLFTMKPEVSHLIMFKIVELILENVNFYKINKDRKRILINAVKSFKQSFLDTE